MTLFDDITASATTTVLSTMGQPIVYSRITKVLDIDAVDSQTITGIFDLKSIAIDTGMGIQATLGAPTLFIRVADLTSPPKEGDRVAVLGRNFRVSECQKDDSGCALLVLKERSGA